MSHAKAEFVKAFAAAKKETLTTLSGDVKTVHVFVGDVPYGAIEKARKDALNRGDMILHDDGSKEWISTVPDRREEMGDEGRYDYVWNKDANRVRCSRYRVILKDGERTETWLRYVWKLYENV